MPPPRGLVAAGGPGAPVRVDAGRERRRVCSFERSARPGSSTEAPGRSGSASRSAIASLAASIPRWTQRGVRRRRAARTRPAAAARTRSRTFEDLEGDDARAVRRMGRDPDAAVVGARSARSRSRCGARRSAVVIGEPAAASPARLALAELARRRSRRSRRRRAARGSPRAPAGGPARRAAMAGRAAGRPRSKPAPGPSASTSGRQRSPRPRR